MVRVGVDAPDCDTIAVRGLMADKGDWVTIVRGKRGVGLSGEVVWLGPSKFGTGQRVGVKTADGETVWTSASAVERSEGGPAQSFRFYGRNPSDWFEGANYGHDVTVSFAQAPTGADLERVASSLLDAGVAWQEPRWSGRQLWIRVGGRGVEFLAAIQGWLRALQSDVPVVDVVFHGLREGDPGYDDPPTAAADMGLAAGLRRPVDARAPAWAPSAAFDAALADIHAAKAAARDRAAIEQALAKQKPSAKVRFEWADGDAPVEPGPVSVPGLPTALGPFRVTVEPDGERALALGSRALLEVDRATGAVRWLPTPAGPDTWPIAAAWLANDHRAVLSHAGIHVFRGEELVTEHKCSAGSLAAFAQGHGLYARGRTSRVFAFAHGKLTRLASLAHARGRVFERNGDMHLATPAGALVARGSGEAIAAAVAKKPRRRKPKSLGVRLLRWTPISTSTAMPDEPDEPDASTSRELPPDLRQRHGLGEIERVASSPSGAWIALQTAEQLFVYEAASESLTPALPRCRSFFVRDDGVLIAYGFEHALWCRKGRPGASEWTHVRRAVGAGTRADYLASLDLLAVALADGTLRIYALVEEREIRTVWECRGFDAAVERAGGVCLRGPDGLVRVDGLEAIAADLRGSVTPGGS